MKQIIHSKRHQKALEESIERIQASPLATYVQSLFLYGSCARGEEKFNSDIDLFLVLSEGVIAGKDLHNSIIWLIGNISSPNIEDPETQLFVTDQNDWQTSRYCYYENLRKDGIEIWH